MSAPKRPPRLVKGRFSIIAACYNVAPYIDDFFDSLFSQTSGWRCLQIIAVDDGSTDETAAKIRQWSERYPGAITYLRQRNQGQAAARNKGLTKADGEWVTFIDPDDFVSDDYVESFLKSLADWSDRDICLATCRRVFYHEQWDVYEDAHPLRFQFRRTDHLREVSGLGTHIIVHTGATWFNHRKIRKAKVRFNKALRCSFEDGDFIARLLLANQSSEIAYLAKPRYLYRKRLDKSSTLDRSLVDPRAYIDDLKNGHLALLQHCASRYGEIPVFIQVTILYMVAWRIRDLQTKRNLLAVLSPRQKTESLNLLKKIFSLIDENIIRPFRMAGAHYDDVVGYLSCLKNSPPPLERVTVEQIDEKRNLVQFSYVSGGPKYSFTALVNGRHRDLQYESQVRTFLVNEVFNTRRYFWLALRPNEFVQIEWEGQKIPIWSPQGECGFIVTAKRISRELAIRAPQKGQCDPQQLRVRRRFQAIPEGENPYQNCWIFMDRGDVADDNAEHLYRYAMKQKSHDNIWFVLKPSSSHAKRLLKEGFRLIPPRSDAFYLALSSASLFISSHSHHSVYRLQDQYSFKYVCLDHGVIGLKDVSSYYNKPRLSLFVKSTQQEFDEVTSEESNYKVSKKEVVLTGLPRHDRLMRMKKSSKTILFAPTWRMNLSEGDQAARSFIERWTKVLNSSGLERIVDEHGLKVRFLPHWKSLPLIKSMSFPAFVNARYATSYQQEIARAAVLISDYSSLTFEAAYAEKPVVYYHFDPEYALERAAESPMPTGHAFDFAKDGFGPVVKTQAALLSAIERAVSGLEHPRYAKRRTDAFAFRDGRCCERVMQKILEIAQ